MKDPNNLSLDEYLVEHAEIVKKNEKNKYWLENAKMGDRVYVSGKSHRGTWLKIDVFNSPNVHWVEIHTGKTCAHWTVLYGAILWASWKDLASAGK